MTNTSLYTPQVPLIWPKCPSPVSGLSASRPVRDQEMQGAGLPPALLRNGTPDSLAHRRAGRATASEKLRANSKA
jgi:hypothetical protein